MAADTPVIIYPEASEIGFDMGARIMFLKTPYSGTGSQREVRWRIYFDSDKTSLMWDSLLVEDDSKVVGNDWIIVWPGRIALAAETTYYVTALVRNTSGESSAESAVRAFIMDSAKTTFAIWARGG